MPVTSPKRRNSLFLHTLLLGIVCVSQAFTGCDPKGVTFHSETVASIGGDGVPIDGKFVPGDYYRNLPGFTCNDQPAIHSKIEITTDEVRLRQLDPSTCQLDGGQTLAAADLQQTPFSKQLVTYGSGLYEKALVPPVPARPIDPVETLCRVTGNPAVALDVVVRDDLAANQFHATMQGALPVGAQWVQQGPQDLIPITRQLDGLRVTYGASNFELSVDRSSDPNALVSGHLVTTYAGTSVDQDVACWTAATLDPVQANWGTIYALPAPLTATLGQEFTFDVQLNVVPQGPDGYTDSICLTFYDEADQPLLNDLNCFLPPMPAETANGQETVTVHPVLKASDAPGLYKITATYTKWIGTGWQDVPLYAGPGVTPAPGGNPYQFTIGTVLLSPAP